MTTNFVLLHNPISCLGLTLIFESLFFAIATKERIRLSRGHNEYSIGSLTGGEGKQEGEEAEVQG